jgi:hypothetical protein
MPLPLEVSMRPVVSPFLLLVLVAGLCLIPWAAPAQPVGAPSLGLVPAGQSTAKDDDCYASEYGDLLREVEAKGPALLAGRLTALGVAYRLLGPAEEAAWSLQLRVFFTYCKSYGSRVAEANVYLHAVNRDRSREAGSSGADIRWEAEGSDLQSFLALIESKLDLEIDRFLRQVPEARLPVSQPPAPAVVAAPQQPAAQPVRSAPPPTVAAKEPPAMKPSAVKGPAPIVAVFDILDDTRRYKPAQLQQLSEYLAGKLAEKGAFRVVPRDQLRSRLQQEKAQGYRQCFDMSCQIELGKAMAAEKSLATKLLQFGKACSVSVTLYDLRSEASEGSATEDQRDCGEQALLEALRRAVDRITAGR